MTLNNAQVQLTEFSRNSTAQWHSVHISYRSNTPKPVKKRGKRGQKFIYAFKYSMSLRRFSRNSRLFDNFLQRTPTLPFYENPTDGLFADIRPHTSGWTRSYMGVFTPHRTPNNRSSNHYDSISRPRRTCVQLYVPMYCIT